MGQFLSCVRRRGGRNLCSNPETSDYEEHHSMHDVIGGSNTGIGGLLMVTNVGGALLMQHFYRFSITP
jgi:hypothetical protein